LQRALSQLDDAGVSLAIQMKSLDGALDWAKLAGSRLAKAIQYGLPQSVPADQITERQLSTLLGFDNAAAAMRIARLDKAARTALLALPVKTLTNLARRLSERELAALASYQEKLSGPAASRLLREVAADPDLMRSLSRPAIVTAIADSRDQLSAVTMLLRENVALNISNIGDDFSLVRQGEVDYRVFLERYWLGLVVLAIFALLILAALRRLLFGRPATVIIRSADGVGKK
jgi:hypothetical protein